MTYAAAAPDEVAITETSDAPIGIADVDAEAEGQQRHDHHAAAQAGQGAEEPGANRAEPDEREPEDGRLDDQGCDRIASRRLRAAMMSRFRRRTMSPTRSLPRDAASSTITFSFQSGDSFELRQVAGESLELLFDLGDAAFEPQAPRLVVAALDRFGAPLPRVQDRAQALFVAERVRAIRFDHEE